MIPIYLAKELSADKAEKEVECVEEGGVEERPGGGLGQHLQQRAGLRAEVTQDPLNTGNRVEGTTGKILFLVRTGKGYDAKVTCRQYLPNKRDSR